MVKEGPEPLIREDDLTDAKGEANSSQKIGDIVKRLFGWIKRTKDNLTSILQETQ